MTNENKVVELSNSNYNAIISVGQGGFSASDITIVNKKGHQMVTLDRKSLNILIREAIKEGFVDEHHIEALEKRKKEKMIEDDYKELVSELNEALKDNYVFGAVDRDTCELPVIEKPNEEEVKEIVRKILELKDVKKLYITRTHSYQNRNVLEIVNGEPTIRFFYRGFIGEDGYAKTEKNDYHVAFLSGNKPAFEGVYNVNSPEHAIESLMRDMNLPTEFLNLEERTWAGHIIEVKLK